MEIERKFLVKNLESIDLSKYEKKEIIQDYLYVDNFTAIRKRKTTSGNITKYTYTVKTDKKGISVNEIEKDITEEQYNGLKLNDKFNSISKTRYVIPYISNLLIELDVFHGVYDGIKFAEIEFENEEQARNIELPTWFEEEISGKISNSEMARRSSKDIINELNA